MSEPSLHYQIPTHLGTPDTLDLPLFGITISLTIRQAVCFLLGGGLVFRLWEQTTSLVGIAGLCAHHLGPLVLAFVTYVIAVQKIHHRYLEDWGLVMIQYLHRPKVFVWRSVDEEPTIFSAYEDAEEQAILSLHDVDEEDTV